MIAETEELKLTDIVDVELLQELQDSFYDLTALSMGISDPQGNEITKHRACHEFCLKYTKGSELGARRCRECDVRAMKISVERGGDPIIYTCHNGLVDFSAPIIVDGKFLGSFLGGQVTEHILEDEETREKARELGIDPDEYVKASRKVPLMDRGHLAKLAKFFAQISNMISQTAYKRYSVQKHSSEVEREANMKSDFLANMSHEIRTPMNAVIGMAEMALREELPPTAREYVHQIKTAGSSLLTIINDILDFSKIESGKMDINLVQYEPIYLVNDISNIILTRIGDKNLEFIVDFDPNIPFQLMGDSSRIKQIIVNLANNAVKFTREGCVKLQLSLEQESEHKVVLRVLVKDTGIGIKPEDLDKLFQSFSQVDSKRNRNIEGTGLGLAISKRLVDLMNGRIWVESEYEKGSTFGFEIPQVMLAEGVSVTISNPRDFAVGIVTDNSYLREQLERDITRFGGRTAQVTESNMEQALEEAEFVFVDQPCFTEEIRRYIEEHPKLTGVLMMEFKATEKYSIPNLRTIKKPAFALNIGAIINHEEIHTDDEDADKVDFDFVAPEARVLIVDDNALNLTVAEGLMKPLQMTVDTALSGKDALEMVGKTHYDMVFMDHMMPEMDGVETTHHIRMGDSSYNMVPIIALTANVMEETRSMFLVEGMNDYIAKPIEIGTLGQKIRQWMPPDKIRPLDEETKAQIIRMKEEESESSRSIKELKATGELDVDEALKLLGGESLFWDVLDDYYKVITKKADLMQKYYEAQDWPDYAIEVHALKSASKQIGANELSITAAKLEQAAKEEDVATIESHHDAMLTNYRYYENVLRPFMKEADTSDEGEEELDVEALKALFARLREAMDDLDMDGMDETAKEMARFRYPEDQQELFAKVRDSVEDMDVDACEELLEQWEKLME